MDATISGWVKVSEETGYSPSLKLSPHRYLGNTNKKIVVLL